MTDPITGVELPPQLDVPEEDQDEPTDTVEHLPDGPVIA